MFHAHTHKIKLKNKYIKKNYDIGPISMTLLDILKLYVQNAEGRGADNHSPTRQMRVEFRIGE
jgi:hypothetical protein